MYASQMGQRQRAKPPKADPFDFAAAAATELCASLRQTAPRRRRTAARTDGTVSIFEDEQSPQFVEGSKITGNACKIGKKPQEAMRESMRTHGSSRQSIMARSIGTEEVGKDGKSVLEKKPRRRTIWVPSDDTTIMTIHPGMKASEDGNTTLMNFCKTQPTQPQSQSQSQEGHPTALVAQPRRVGKRTSLAAAPRRMALQPTLKPLQEDVAPMDRYGQDTGKENVPPGYGESVYVKKASQILLKRRASVLPPLPSMTAQSVNANSRKRDLASPVERPAERAKPRRPSMMPPRRMSVAPQQNEQKSSVKPPPEIQPLLKLSKPRMSSMQMSTSIVQQYPLIHESIEQPRMFEESWLSYQETAITELVNRLFSNQSSRPKNAAFGSLRRRLLHLYQGRPMLLLYQKLQASLKFGALCLPKERENGSESARFVSDIGLRQQFTRLWMKTYNERALKAACEAVVGRQVTSSDPSFSKTQVLENFISSCLLRNEDAGQSREQTSAKNAAWNWRRTMQRCLMIISLLDTAASTSIIPTNLFKTSSSHKSSASVLAELTSILLPWGGDMMRPLGHLDYHLQHTQHPLSEFDYTVTNLAVDLRDGIRLTRLVELLLYPAASDSKRRDSDDSTISMPTGEVLCTSHAADAFGVLSRHLKYPCIGRAAKAYNCQIALSTLLGVRSVAQVAARITANDIVDGHRENTLALLWALVGHWGLGQLIDWEDVKGEIARLSNGAVVPGAEGEEEGQGNGMDVQRRLTMMMRWAESAAEKHGLKVANSTTAFADGKLFEALVDEYQPYLGGLTPAHRVSGDQSLEAKLQSLGCSSAFSSLFAQMRTSQGRFFDSDFTAASLAFLCSRLLGPSKPVREQRAALKRVAEDCRTVVVMRNKVTDAATVLQRAWRGHWGRRMERYERGDVDVWLL